MHILEKDYVSNLQPIFILGAIQRGYCFLYSPYPPAYQRSHLLPLCHVYIYCVYCFPVVFSSLLPIPLLTSKTLYCIYFFTNERRH